MKRLIAIAFSITAVLVACDRNGSRPNEQAVPKTNQHATADVQPGSHEDWCGEHGVAESQCTQCDPALIPAFKATGDWCDEHGVPESQCTKCNPDLKIVRPPKAE